jgi:8-oxo-dGTP pyrophosphatase MutT (NUDIX family)
LGVEPRCWGLVTGSLRSCAMNRIRETMSSSPSSAGTLSSIPRFDPREVPIVHRHESLPAVPQERLAISALRQQLLSPPPWEPELTGDRFRVHARPVRSAAVLIPIVAHPGGATILLTERTAHLHDHAGQIAFPGGRTDPQDQGPVDTALRETHEEIGLQRNHIEIIACLPDYLTGTGYQVTPVVGIIEPGFELQLDAFEVAEAFEVPLHFLMNPRFHQRRHVVHGEIDRTFYAMPWQCEKRQREYFIWGATAAMLRNLYRLLSA